MENERNDDKYDVEIFKFPSTDKSCQNKKFKPKVVININMFNKILIYGNFKQI